MIYFAAVHNDINYAPDVTVWGHMCTCFPWQGGGPMLSLVLV